jgi:hypothetical protein
VRGCFLDKDVNVKCDSAHSFSTTEHEMEIKWKEIIQFKWFKRLYILYIFGTILSFRPSAPFFYEFLTTNKNFSDDEVNQEVVPLLYYSTAVQLLPVFLLMEFVKFNPFLIICTLTGIISTCLYIWTDSLTQIQIAQVGGFSMFAPRSNECAERRKRIDSYIVCYCFQFSGFLWEHDIG